MNDCENNFIREAIEQHQKVEIYFKSKNRSTTGIIVDVDDRTVKVRTLIGFPGEGEKCQLIYKDSIERIMETF